MGALLAAFVAVIAAACGGPSAPPSSSPAPAAGPAPEPPTLEVRTPRQDALLRIVRLEVRPSSVEVAVDGRARLRITALDAQGLPVAGAPLRFSGLDGSARVTRDGTVAGMLTVVGVRPGTDTLVVQAPAPEGIGLHPIEVRVPVTVRPPAARTPRVLESGAGDGHRAREPVPAGFPHDSLDPRP